jgi:hypothetical protein
VVEGEVGVGDGASWEERADSFLGVEGVRLVLVVVIVVVRMLLAEEERLLLLLLIGAEGTAAKTRAWAHL